MGIAVEIRGVTKDFPSGDEVVRVLHGIDLDIEENKLTMIVGPSGCGKTTLLSIITSILTPTEGSVKVEGVDITKLRDRQKVLFRRSNFGFIFQQYNLLPALTAVENASVPLIAAGKPRAGAEAIARDVLTELGMGDHLHKLPNQLSGGQQQRVSIARALVHNPKVIVCDEPTAALDAHSGHVVMEMLRKIALQGQRAVIVVTHDNRIFEFADKMVYMEDGKIISQEDKKR
jgi:putative ABC transport system ATP-binding protein